MALYKDFSIDGGTVTLNMDVAQAVIHTGEAAWIWDNGGAYVKFSIKDGEPVTQCSMPQKDAKPKHITSHWVEKVGGKSDLGVDISVDGAYLLEDFARYVVDKVMGYKNNGCSEVQEEDPERIKDREYAEDLIKQIYEQAKTQQ